MVWWPGAGMGFPSPPHPLCHALGPLRLQGCDWRMHLMRARAHTHLTSPLVFVSMLFDLTLLHSPCADRELAACATKSPALIFLWYSVLLARSHHYRSCQLLILGPSHPINPVNIKKHHIKYFDTCMEY